MPGFCFLRQWGMVPREFMALVEQRVVKAVCKARDDNPRAADHYRQALHIVRTHPDDFEPTLEASMQRLIDQLDPGITT